MTSKKSARTVPADLTGNTTTHAAPGAGRPRLVFIVGDGYWSDDSPRDFELIDGTTLIGSADGAHLRLEGLLPAHAEIRHDAQDKYVLFTYGDAQLSSGADESEQCQGHTLRTGFRVDLGDWRMSFFRDEFADHGRPFGGRQGGEWEQQQPQLKPDYR